MDVEGPRPLWVTQFPRKAILGCIRKLAKHRSLAESPNSVPPWNIFCFKFLPWLPKMID